jgi:23S rRNA (uracil1939-C5)-methyltransferase
MVRETVGETVDEAETLDVRIRTLGSGGVGVGDLPDGRVVFVARTAPGDLARIKLTQDRERWAKGKLLELLEEGPARVQPPCPHYANCDGCSLQHLPYELQRSSKAEIVGDALRRIGGLEVTNPEVTASPTDYRYRNKVSFVLRRLKGGKVVAGFHHRDVRRRIVDVGPECLLPEEGLAALWGRLREGWGAGARHLPSGGELRLELREWDGKGSLLIQGGQGSGNPKALLRDVPGLVSIWRRGSVGNTTHQGGDQFLEIPWLEGTTRLRGGAFLQVNTPVGQLLHEHVLELAGDVEGRKVVEAYAGSGLLGKILVGRGANVVSIESDPDGVKEAERDAPEGFTPILGAVEDALSYHLPADLLLLNPPRGGMDEKVPELLRAQPVPAVIYVSCDPATLARDLKRMGDGYEVRGLKSFDLFPQTSHVETVVSLVSRDG